MRNIKNCSVLLVIIHVQTWGAQRIHWFLYSIIFRTIRVSSSINQWIIIINQSIIIIKSASASAPASSSSTSSSSSSSSNQQHQRQQHQHQHHQHLHRSSSSSSSSSCTCSEIWFLKHQSQVNQHGDWLWMAWLSLFCWNQTHLLSSQNNWL